MINFFLTQEFSKYNVLKNYTKKWLLEIAWNVKAEVKSFI